MKKYILITLAIVLTLPLFAQRQDRREKVKTLKIAYITEKLNLTKEEAQEFWPVYNEFEQKTNELRRQGRNLRKDLSMESITDDEALRLLTEISMMENKRQELKDLYTADLLKVIPAKKVLLLKKAEDDFNRRMIEEFKRRRQEKKGH